MPSQIEPPTLPQFLIIGAMKAGTTTLHEDLAQVPGIYMCPDKEPEDLLHSAVETPDGRAAYGAKFAGAALGDICGESSTAYTKRPTFHGVAARARAVLGPDLKLIYLRRDPIKRMVSHYHHMWGMGIEQRPMRKALLEDTTYLDYSRYDWQLEPWRAEFPEEQILLLDFEEFIANRAAVLAKVCAFLGRSAPENLRTSHRNASDGKHFLAQGSLLRRLRQTRLYLFLIKPLLPSNLRDQIKRMILPKAKPLEEALSEDVREILVARLAKSAQD